MRLAPAVTVILALVLATCRPEEPARRTPAGPNLLVLVMDTTRADRCSLNGYRRPTTPSLEALARESVTYRNAWSPSCWTPPAHASLFTGLLPEHHGLNMANRWYLEESARTLAEILRDAGYRTACYSDNPFVSPAYGLTQGFETLEPIYQRGPRSESRCRVSHAEALAWATGVHRRGERFFLFINDMEPHLPRTPAEPYRSRFLRGSPERAAVDEATRFESPKDLQYCVGVLDLPEATLGLLSDLYDAEIAGLDDAIGTLIEGLREAGLLDETILIVTADHGEALGEHHMIGHNLGLQRWLLRVPMLVRWPGGKDGGTVVEDVVRLEDLMPTCLEGCGLPVPDGLDARSLLHDVSGRTSTAFLGPPRGQVMAQVVRETHATKFDVSVRSATDGRHQLIRWSDGREALHDVIEDPEEKADLTASRPEVVRRLRALLGVE